MAALRRRVRQLKPDALVMGEVWEDASNKMAYGVRRRYFVDGTLDSVMNYPFRTAILNFLRGTDDGSGLEQTVMTILENYPAQVVSCNMNMLGTHDTPRILTALVDDYDGPRQELAKRRLTGDQLALAKARLRQAAFLQYTLPGSPSLYYGDEAGMEGGKDPFNRRTYPWGREDEGLLAHHRALGRLRKTSAALRLGDTAFFCAEKGRIGFSRSVSGTKLRIYLNRGEDSWEIPAGKLLFAEGVSSLSPDWLKLARNGMCIVEER